MLTAAIQSSSTPQSVVRTLAGFFIKNMMQKIINELDTMLLEDQLVLKEFVGGKIEKSKWQERVTKQTSRIKKIFEEFGGAKKKTDGTEAYRAMFILILHSGDVELMEKYLTWHRQSDTKEIELADQAFLIDKIRILSNQPQLYGTQYKIVDSGIVFLPIEDVQDVNRKRELLGMATLEDYKTGIQKSQNLSNR